MGVRAVWSPDTPGTFTASVGAPRHQQFLLVERLPSGDWDWVAWSGSDAERARHGVADTAAAAMQAAECAAATQNAARIFFSATRSVLLQQWSARPN